MFEVFAKDEDGLVDDGLIDDGQPPAKWATLNFLRLSVSTS
jgi:hypothetical protein